jgi:hypothetical protein
MSTIVEELKTWEDESLQRSRLKLDSNQILFQIGLELKDHIELEHFDVERMKEIDEGTKVDWRRNSRAFVSWRKSYLRRSLGWTRVSI